MDFEGERNVIRSRFRATARRLRNTNNLMDDFQSLLQSGAFADVRLRCGSEVFRAHKSILSARSPVFAEMLLDPPASGDCVEIRGVEPSVLRVLLGYVYSSRTGPLNASLACGLLAAAHAYQLAGLKRTCVDFLRHVMCDENALHIVKIAYLYDENLKADVCHYVCDRYEMFEVKPAWKALQTECPHVVIEIMAKKNQYVKVQ